MKVILPEKEGDDNTVYFIEAYAGSHTPCGWVKVKGYCKPNEWCESCPADKGKRKLTRDKAIAWWEER